MKIEDKIFEVSDEACVEDWVHTKNLVSVIRDENGPVCSFKHNGMPTKDIKFYDELVQSLGFKNVTKQLKPSGTTMREYLNDDSYFKFVITDPKIEDTPSVSIYGLSRDSDILEKLYNEFKPYIKKYEEVGGYVKMMVSNRRGLEFKTIGKAGMPLVKSNYDTGVIKGFNHVVKSLKSKEPSGRLIILDGPPGTGKSYLIRGLIDSVKDVQFIFIPSDMVSELSKPQFIPSVMEEANENGPMVIIVEDADSILTTRKAGNMNALSSVLNMADGLFGSIFDLRIIASTNADLIEFDKAVIRPGRLDARISIGNLDYKQASKIYAKLKGKGKLAKGKSYTLAEIYAQAQTEQVSDNFLESKSFGNYM